MRQMLALLLGLGLSSACADAYDFYGFSPNGRYLAFAQHGWGGDGGEQAQTELFVLDSAKNSIMAHYASLAAEPGEGRAGLLNAQQVFNQAAPLLKKFGIRDTRSGTLVWTRTPPEARQVRAQPTSPDVFPQAVPGQPDMVPAQHFSALSDRWQFRLAQLPYGVRAYKCPPNGTRYASFTRGFLLEVTSKAGDSTVTTTLQEDGATVPRSRACAFHYEPVEVRVQGRFVAVTLAVYSVSGFEAETTRKFIVVTGRKP